MAKKVNPAALQEDSLRHFLEVARSGSVTKAAAKLNVAPSAVSRHLARLESELDTLLFVRGRKGMQLNSAGELLAAHATRAWQGIEELVDALRGLRGQRTGVLRLVCTEGFAFELVPRLISQYQRENPAVRFVLDVASQSDIARRVREGVADVGFAISLTSEKGVNVELRIPSPILAIVSSKHPLASRRQLTLKQLVGYPLALPGPASTLRQLFDVSCSRQGIHIDPHFSSARLDSLISFAAAGGGVTLSGELVLKSRISAGEVVGVPLRDREMNERHLEVQTMAGRALPLHCRSFVEFLRLNLEERAQ